MRIPIEKISIAIIVLVFIFVVIFSFSLFVGSQRYLGLVYPRSGEEFYIGETYEITWVSSNIEKVGIVLFKGEEPRWIARDIDAFTRKYEWKIQQGEHYGDNYWIAVLEYPYREDSLVDYSKGPFSIIFSDITSCDTLSVSAGWPYIPIGFPKTRKVFITSERYDGNLKGIEGADEICMKESEKLDIRGEWMAFIGGDRDRDTAVQRISRTERGAEGVFVRALPEGELLGGENCHRLLAKDFEDFLSLFYGTERSLREKLGSEFFTRFLATWTGRIKESDKSNCGLIASSRRGDIEEDYTYTLSCQNWTTRERIIPSTLFMGSVIFEDPSLSEEEEISVEEEDIMIYPQEGPSCYTPQGALITARGLGGLSPLIIEGTLNLQARGCGERHHILCVEK